MRFRIAPALALGLAVATIGLAGTASASASPAIPQNARPAGPMVSSSATVGGMSAGDFVGLGTGSPLHCPSGYFCLFTLPGYQGKMFALSDFSQQYTLTGWSGNGSYADNSNNYWASVLDRYGNDLVDIPDLNFGSYDAGWANPQYSFSSAAAVTFWLG